MSTFLTDIAKVLKSDQKTGDKSFYGVVKEKITDGSTVTGYKVSIGGDEDIVEARKMAGAEVGDTVLCTLLSNGSVVVSGRKDGDKDAQDAQERADEAYDKAEDAESAAEEAESAVEIVKSHFWTDENGVHVTQNESSTAGKNVLINSNGMIIANGNPATTSNQLAAFGASQIELGKNSIYSQIKLCGGLCIIKYDNDFYGLSIETEGNPINISCKDQPNNAESGIYIDKDMVSITSGSSGDSAGMEYAKNLFEFYDDVKVYGNITAVNIPSGTILTSSNYKNYSTFSGIVKGSSVSTTGNVTAGGYLRSNTPQSGSKYGDTYWHEVDSSTYRLDTTSSSRSLKKNIKDVIDPELNPESLYDLPVRQFNWKNKEWGEQLEIGFIADEVEKHYKPACCYDDDTPRDWNSRTMIPAMLKLIQDQHKEIEELKQRVEALEKK